MATQKERKPPKECKGNGKRLIKRAYIHVSNESLQESNASLHSCTHDSASQMASKPLDACAAFVIYLTKPRSIFAFCMCEENQAQRIWKAKYNNIVNKFVFSFSRHIYFNSLIWAEKIIQWDLKDSFSESSFLVSHWESNTGTYKKPKLKWQMENRSAW